MTEYGAQALVTDWMWRDHGLREVAYDQLRRALNRVGVTEIAIEQQRAVYPPSHDSIEFPECAYAVFERLRPGADADEKPDCHHGEHWLKGFVGWEVNAHGVTDA